MNLFNRKRYSCIFYLSLPLLVHCGGQDESNQGGNHADLDDSSVAALTPKPEDLIPV